MTILDLTGQRFGRLVALELVTTLPKRGAVWLCACDCGKYGEIVTSSLRAGTTRSCGCIQRDGTHARIRDLTGQRFGRLVVLRQAGRNKRKQVRWLCSCDCGESKTVDSPELVRGNTRSCGCLNREAVAERARTHAGSHTAEYSVWHGMWNRCTNPNSEHYARYKDRTPPESWRDFAQFLSDMGPRPSAAHSIDRKDNSKPYGPDNCRWATKKEQSQNMSTNRLIEYRGQRKLIAEWAAYLRINESTLYGRLRVWDVDRAFNTPIRKKLSKGPHAPV